MVLHDCGKIELVKKRNPMPQSFSKGYHIVGVGVRVVASREYGVVIVCKQKIIPFSGLCNLSNIGSLLLV